MDVVFITCPRCGYTEGYQHPESVRERRECPGCVAEELIRGGLLYRLDELAKQWSSEQVREAGIWSAEKDGL